MSQIIITVDLGYGDSGKGTMIDALARNAPTELVVRYSGGAQAAHNVVTPTGEHHTFAQFGSGTFVENVKSYLGPEVLVDPHRLLVENNYLQKLGVIDALRRLTIDRKAPLLTEFNVVINQTREHLRNSSRHGSCGLGIWETRLDSRTYGDAMLHVEDILDLKKAKEKLLFFREEKKKVLHRDFPQYFGATIHPHAERSYKIFTDDGFIEETLQIYSRMAGAITVGDSSVIADALATGKQVLFESSQGVLLDERSGFLPYVTGSDVTSGGAHRLLDSIGAPADRYTLGIVRAYMSRHGAGPLITEDKLLTSKIIEEHNSSQHQWQGVFRIGWFDPIAISYAIEATNGVDGLAVTCIDQILPFEEYKYATSYTDRSGKQLTQIQSQKDHPDDIRTRMTQELSGCTPNYQSHPMVQEAIIKTIESTCSAPVVATSRGKSALDKEINLPL